MCDGRVTTICFYPARMLKSYHKAKSLAAFAELEAVTQAVGAAKIEE